MDIDDMYVAIDNCNKPRMRLVVPAARRECGKRPSLSERRAHALVCRFPLIAGKLSRELTPCKLDLPLLDTSTSKKYG